MQPLCHVLAAAPLTPALCVAAAPISRASLRGRSALAETAGALGLPTATIRDAGRTQVQRGAWTVLMVGPALEASIDPITRHLKLL